MGYYSAQLKSTKAVGDPGNNFGGALQQILFGNGFGSLRSTAELLGATVHSPWAHLATVLIAVRQAETQFELLRPGSRVIEGSQDAKGRFTGARWKSGGERQHHINKNKLLPGAISPRALKERSEQIADFKSTGFLTEQQDHPFLDMVRNGTMSFPDPILQMSGFEVASLFSTIRQGVGEFYYLLFRQGSGVPRAWLPLPPHWVTPPIGPDRNYHISMGSVGQFAGVGGRWSVPPGDIAAYRRPNPVHPYTRGVGSLHAIDHDLVIDENAAKHMGATLENRAVPALLMVMANLQPKEKLKMEEEWRSGLTGAARAGLTKFLPMPQGANLAKDLFIKELQTSPQNLEMSQVRRHERDLALEVTQVPPLIAGVHESGNRAMAQVAEELMQLNAVAPANAAVVAWYQSRFFEPFGGQPPEYQGGFILNWRSPEQIDDTSRNQMMRIVPQHFSRRDFLTVGGQQPRPGDEFIYTVPNTHTLIDSRTNTAIFTPPVTSTPFGADAGADGTKMADVLERLEELEAQVA